MEHLDYFTWLIIRFFGSLSLYRPPQKIILHAVPAEYSQSTDVLSAVIVPPFAWQPKKILLPFLPYSKFYVSFKPRLAHTSATHSSPILWTIINSWIYKFQGLHHPWFLFFSLVHLVFFFINTMHLNILGDGECNLNFAAPRMGYTGGTQLKWTEWTRHHYYENIKHDFI